MEVSSNTNSFQLQSQVQQHTRLENSIQPVPQEDPTFNNKEIYEASQGNLIRNDDSHIALTPQGQTNVANKQEETATQNTEEAQTTKDEQRASGVEYIAQQSKQSQVEIYLSVATDSNAEVGVNGDTASIIESLRDVQKQNNAVEAYATYEQNQNTPINNFSRGLAG